MSTRRNRAARARTASEASRDTANGGATEAPRAVRRAREVARVKIAGQQAELASGVEDEDQVSTGANFEGNEQEEDDGPPPKRRGEVTLRTGDLVGALDRFGNWTSGFVFDVREKDSDEFGAEERRLLRKPQPGRRRLLKNIGAIPAREAPPESWVLVPTENAQEWLYYGKSGTVCVAKFTQDCPCLRHIDDARVDAAALHFRTPRLKSAKRRRSSSTTKQGSAKSSRNRQPSKKQRRRSRVRDDEEDSSGERDDSSDEEEEEDFSGEDDDEVIHSKDVVSDEEEVGQAEEGPASTRPKLSRGAKTGTTPARPLRERRASRLSSAGGTEAANKGNLADDARLDEETNDNKDAAKQVSKKELARQKREQELKKKREDSRRRREEKKRVRELKREKDRKHRERELERRMKAEETRDTFPGTDEQIIAEMVAELHERMDLTMSQMFREAGLEGPQMNSAYLWIKDQCLHRETVLAAGDMLRKWFRRNYDKVVPLVQVRAKTINPVASRDATPSRNKNKKRKSGGGAESRKRSRANGGRVTDPISNLPDGVSLGTVSGAWEVRVPLVHGVQRVLIAQFRLCDDAIKAMEKANAAVYQQTQQLLVERRVAVEQLEQHGGVDTITCEACQEACPDNEDSKAWKCTLCTRRMHVQDCVERQFEAQEFGPEFILGQTCPRCLKILLQAAREAAKAVERAQAQGDAGSSSRGRALRKREAGGVGATALSGSRVDFNDPALFGGSEDAAQRASAYGFPVSKSYIKPLTQPRPKNKTLRRRDGVDLASNSQWTCEGFLDGGIRSRSRMYFRSFRYLDMPDVEYHVLDHVMLFRINPDGEEEVDEEDEEDEDEKKVNGETQNGIGSSPKPKEELLSPVSASGTRAGGGSRGSSHGKGSRKGSSNGKGATPDFYVGQIEAMWEEPEGDRKVRVAWFFWPSETPLAESGVLPNEVYSSNEVDVVPLSSIAAKIRVVPLSTYKELTTAPATSPSASSRQNGAGPAVPPQTPQALRVPGSPVGGEAGGASATSLPGRNTETRSTSRKGGNDVAFELDVDETGDGGAGTNESLETGAILRVKHRAKLEAASKLLFARKHFHYRANKEVGADHPSVKAGDGRNPWMHSFLLADVAKPDSLRLLDDADKNDETTCSYTLGVADTVGDPELETLKSVQSIEELLDNCPSCAFCSETLPFAGHIVCAVCTGVHVCFTCFMAGRQGMVTPSISANGGDQAGLPPDDSKNAKLRLLHRSGHAYRVAAPTLDYSNPKLAVEILDWMCSMHGLRAPTYELIEIVRGPLPSKELRGASVRYRYSIVCEYSKVRMRAKHPKTGQVARVMGNRHAKTVLAAKGVVAIDALLAVFGVSNKLNMPILSTDWTGREALRLVDSLGIHSLAWEPAEEVVGSKKALECASFFSCNLHPAWAAQNEWAQELKRVNESALATARNRDRYTRDMPPPASTAVEVATQEAMEWGDKVHQMALRRSKISRRTKRGLAFATIDGQTVFARRPDAFGTRVTDETDAILKLSLDPAKVPPNEEFLVREASKLRDQAKAALCSICNKGDRIASILLCDGCDSEYHLDCLVPPLKDIPESDWFCEDCISDREYLYDHESWKDAGGTLARMVERDGVLDLAEPTLEGLHARASRQVSGGVGGGGGSGSGGDDSSSSNNNNNHTKNNEDDKKAGPAVREWEVRVLEWRDNDKVVEAASANAVRMGFSAGAPVRSRSSQSSRARALASNGHNSSSSSSSSSNASSSNANSSRKKSSSSSSSSSALQRSSSSVSDTKSTKSGLTQSETKSRRKSRPVTASSSASGETTKVVHSVHPPYKMSDVEVLECAAWKSRHHAAQTVANLEASNRGLAEALSQVVAQRDALLRILQKAPQN